MSLRFFIYSLLFLLLSSCAGVGSYKKPQGFSILQGLTSETTSEFTVVIEKDLLAKFTVITPQGETLQPEKVEMVTNPRSNWAVHKVRFANLINSADPYRLMVEGGGTRDERTFKVFSNHGEKLRFVVGSCTDSRFADKQKMIWDAVHATKPEWVFLIGDNVYVTQNESEVTNENNIWDRYIEARQQYDIYFWKELVPTYAVWDDNDYGQNNGHKDYVLKEKSQQIFKTFFAQSYGADFYTPGPGVAGRLDLRGMHFTFLDNRSFRDSDKNGTHFGEEQESWLFNDLKKSQLPTWILSGDQFFGGYHEFESYEGNHAAAFENFLKKLKEIPTPFVFVSGDRHMTEIMQFPRALLGQLSFEFTSSPIHSKLYPKKDEGPANPWRVIMRDDSHNFMLVDTALAATSWNIVVEARNAEGQLFSRDLSLTTEALKDFTIEKQQKRRRYRRAKWRRR